MAMTKAVLDDNEHQEFTRFKEDMNFPNVQTCAGELIRRQLKEEGYL